MSAERPGLTRPTSTSAQHSSTTINAIPLSNARHDSAYALGATANSDFSQLHLAPATRQTVVTTTTTTTVHFAPILLPRTRAVIPAEASFNRNAPAAFAKFMELDEARPLALDPKLYPLSQQTWPGGMRNFRLGMGALEATFVEGGIEEDGLEESFSEDSQLDKGKGKETNLSARSAHAIRKKSRRSRSGPAIGLNQNALDMMDSGVDIIGLNGGGIARLPSPGPPRKRPRPEGVSNSRSSSMESEFETAQEVQINATHGSGGIAGTLPSPNLSPPSPVPTFVAGEDDQERAEYYAEQDGMDGIQSEGTEQPTTKEQDEALEYDFGAGHSLSGLLSLPDFVNTFDQLSPALQSYFIYTFLKRSSIPVLQTINNIIAPSLRRDFLTDLPPELGIQILGYLDAKTLCRASIVCKGWRRLVDGEWRVWKKRLLADGLWVGDGSEAKEAKEISGGSKDNLFLKRWKAGIWDEPALVRRPSRSWEVKREPVEDIYIDGVSSRRPSTATNLASPSSSRGSSPLPSGHYVHPFKTLYRRRFVTRRNWAETEPKRISFACHANNVVTCLQFDKDKIVSASDDHSINVFDTRTGETKARLDGHEGGVWALQYIGNVLVSGSTDRTVRVWNLEKGKCTQTFVGHTSTVRCLQIVEPENIQTDPHGEPIWEPPYPLIVTGSRDWSLRVWKLPSERDKEYHPHVPTSPTEENTDPKNNPFHLRHLDGHKHAVRALAAHGRTLVSGSYDCSVRVWDILTGECKYKLTGHNQKVYSVVYDPLRKQCASGSMDGTVRLWSTETGECRATLEGHTSLVGLLGLSYRTVVSAAADSTLRIWDPKTGECRHTLAAHSGAITCFQHDEYKVISGSDGTLKMWDVQTGTFTRDLLSGLTGVWQVSFDNRFCVAAVQRNGQSEFEILDFGPVDLEEEEKEAGGSDYQSIVEVEEVEPPTSSQPTQAQLVPPVDRLFGPAARGGLRRVSSSHGLSASTAALASTLTSTYRARISQALADAQPRLNEGQTVESGNPFVAGPSTAMEPEFDNDIIPEEREAEERENRLSEGREDSVEVMEISEAEVQVIDHSMGA